MKKVFIDCGGNTGAGLRNFIGMYGMDKEWIIETFEPNTLCKLSDNIQDLINNFNITIHEKAIYNYTGIVEFSVMLENSEGSSVECLMSEADCKDASNPSSYRHHNNIIKVNCISLIDVLEKYNSEDFIVVKMDVEGSEFKIVRNLLDNKETLKKINHLYVEWHTRCVFGENEYTHNFLKHELINNGVQLFDWH